MHSTLMFRLDRAYLIDLATKYREAYAQAEPFPHVVIDNFLPESILDDVLQEFPKVNSVDWKKFDNSAEKKLAFERDHQVGDNTRLLLYLLNSSTFMDFLENLTGISGLVPDPHFVGGGLHQIERGGYLKIHADFNRHSRLNLDRRLNLLLYLNKNWQEEYGGHLELWNKDMTECEAKVLPVFNRCVVFNTDDYSYHGHPQPLTCPTGQTRKSLALYYYTNGRPDSEASDSHSTLFRARPEGDSGIENSGIELKNILRKLVPPILVDARNYLRNRN
ncbi:MAG: 2OG-Fe(II) oxygenase [Chroococcidiopsidaceae cyanobacterium CP_BM_RX_35]|nr:2OG-Fe(II) oxygenase [Chroococcidiopsidaceae cyanobacterium CP_BM_RX_35]